MIRFDDLALFIRSAATGSFSNAAREVDLLPAQVSAAIKRLEDELGVRLFARSTRSLRLTVEGERYLPYAREALGMLREGRDRLMSETSVLSGTLQITAPSDLGRNVLLEPITAFRRRHPGLEIRLSLSDEIIDVYRNPADIALRYGVVEDASFVSMPIAPDNYRVLFASPAYLDRCGRPRTLADLQGHTCLLYMVQGRTYDKWEFGAGDERVTMAVSGPLVSDDADVVRRWAIAGEGIGFKSWLDIGDDVRAGRLEVVLPDIPGKRLPLNLICPHRRQFSPAVQQLHAALKQYCELRLKGPPAVRLSSHVALRDSAQGTP